MSAKKGEASDRKRRTIAGGGTVGNDLLEDEQLRGVDEEGRMKGGTHGGPTKPHRIEGQDSADGPRARGRRAEQAARAGHKG